MAVTKIVYGTETAIDITLNSMASSSTAGRVSTAVDNTTTRFLNATVQVEITTTITGTPPEPQHFILYLYAGNAAGQYPDRISGTDAAFTFPSAVTPGRTNLCLITDDFIWTPTTGTLVWTSAPFAVARWFGGIMPPFWGLGVLNRTGFALASSGNFAKFIGITTDTV